MLKIFVDTDCDVTPEIANKYGFGLISMPYVEKENVIRPYEDWETYDPHAFYDKLRHGELATTCALAPTDYIRYFEPYFEKGDDILYVHFSSAMTSTFNSMRLALDDLMERYPDRKFYACDTLCITIPALAIVERVGELALKGASAEEIVEFVEKEKQHYACYFFADDLKFFARSGRVSGISAVMGNLLGIKPIININSAGKMGSIAKGKGRLKSIEKVLDYVEALQEDMKSYPVYVASTDCDGLAKKFISVFTERFGDGFDIRLVPINPTAGAHCGPDSTGIAFHAKSRE
ncbi:MAG: DegV family protein [Candidatus Enteromonas sp.]|nr:DegV family protein [Candidatus Enteromonas sp.]